MGNDEECKVTLVCETEKLGSDPSTSSSFTNNSSNDMFVEVTLDLLTDSVTVHNVNNGECDEDPEITLLALKLERKTCFDSSRFKQVTEQLRRLPTLTQRRSGGRSAAAHALEGFKFISRRDIGAGWWAAEEKFNKLTATTNGLLPRSLFGEWLGMDKASNQFAEELFNALARRRNITADSINKEELREFWEQISDQSFDSRLQTYFDMVDKDDDGRITEEEIKEIISLSASANRLSNIQKQAGEYAAFIMEELDPDNLGFIMIDSLEELLLQAPNHSSRGADSGNLSQTTSPRSKPTRESNPLRRRYLSTKYFFLDNWKRIWVMALWLGIIVGLFAYKFIQYRNKVAYDVMGYCVCTAKGAAETLKFNMALILLPVCRNTITWLRNKAKLVAAIPFDDNLNFHKVIAIAVGLGIVLHVGAHVTCDFPRILHATKEEYEPLRPYYGHDQPENYWWFVKGVEALTGIMMMVLMIIASTFATSPFMLKTINLPKPLKRVTGFSMYWYSHHLFVVVYVLLIVHGIHLYLTKEWYKKTTWMYLAVPVVLYACERLIRAFRSGIKPVKFLKVALYPGNVLALHISKPRGFKYKSGQYMFLNCFEVSPFEWHPFFITSAPRDEYLSVHIRTQGDWTQQLKTVFSEACQPSTGDYSGLLRNDCMQGSSTPVFPKVLIDGPYGASAQDYKKYEVLLLVGLGIGATPMISIVKDILNNIKTKDGDKETALENGTGTPSANIKKKKGFKTWKAYFYWVTREQGSFQWFKGIMNEVAEMDQEGVIELHNYCTSVYEEGDARSALISMLQSLNHAKNGVDVVSGTRVKSHFAKPKWRSVYRRIVLQHSDTRVGVFFCGAPLLTKELGQLALEFSRKTSTKFDFHHQKF